MARGTQLTTLVDMVRYECRHSSVPATGLDANDRLKHMIRRKQEELYDQYDWPHLHFRPTITLQAGQRYYDLPAGLNLEQIENVHLKESGRYRPLCRGIGFEHYNQHDSDLDERADPARAWEVVWTGTATQIEVWPIPATNGNTIRIWGKRSLRPLVDDSDVADLDDLLIVLHVAAEILAAQKSEDAEIKAALAQQRLNVLRNRIKSGTEEFVLGGGSGRPRPKGLTARWNPNP